jgi:hypothetical protein
MASGPMRKSLLRVLPWLVTAGLLFLLFRRISFAEVVADTRRAAGWMVPVTLLCVTAVYLADSFAIWKTFGWFPDAHVVHGRAARARGDVPARGDQLQRRPGRDRLFRPSHRRHHDHAAASPPSCSCSAPTCWRCCSWRRPASASRPPSPAR